MSAFLLVPMKADVSMGQFYKRRFLRILPPMIIFMLLYATLPVLWGEMTWDDTLRILPTLPFNFPENAGHLWFMYPLISLYLIIPVVSPWLERATAKEERIFIGIFAFTTLIPWLHRFVSAELWGECFWNGFSMFWYCSDIWAILYWHTISVCILSGQTRNALPSEASASSSEQYSQHGVSG